MRITIFLLVLVSICNPGYAKQKPESAAAIPAESESEEVSSAPWWVQRFKVSVGAFFPVNATEVKVGTTDGKFGTTISLENDLGFATTTSTFLAGAQWRISRRSRVAFTYYTINRTADKALEKDIQFYDSTYHASANVHAFFNTSIYQITYGYAILSRPKYEAGLMIGTHLAGTTVGVNLKANGSTGISGQQDFGFTAPLPDFGVWGGYAFTNRFAINAEFSFLSLGTSEVKGRILSYNVILTYKIVDELTLSAGYTGLNFDITATQKKYEAYVKWGYNGPSFMLSYSFGKKYWD